MMKSTLAVIINHNRRAYTDQLYDALFPFQQDGDYELVVLDNGTPDPEERSKYTTYETESNCYYGGAVNLIFEMFLQTEHDSLMILNNDVILHGYNFVRALRDQMNTEDYDLVSPAALQPEVGQCYWPQMHNWGYSSIRPVKWVDFMCPMLSRRLVEEIGQYDTELIYGWGQDAYAGIVCENNGWRVGVYDPTTIIHMSSQTFRDGKSDITHSEYSQKAMQGMVSYFNRVGLGQKLNEYRTWGRTYNASQRS